MLKLITLGSGILCLGLFLTSELVPRLISNDHDIHFMVSLMRSDLPPLSQDAVFRSTIDCSPPKVVSIPDKNLPKSLMGQFRSNELFNRVPAIVQLRQGDCYDAINSLANIIDHNPNDQIARFWLGKAYFAAEQDELALQTWQNVDNLESYLVDLGWRLYLQHNVEEGLKYLLWATHVDPNRGPAASFLAYIYWDEGQSATAYEWSIRADQLGASDQMVYIGPCRYFLWSKIDLQKASHWCDLGLEHFPNSAWLWHLRGWIYLQINNPEKALFNFQNARSIDPNNLDAHLMAGRLLAKTNIPAAIEAYQAVLGVDPNHTVAVCELADIYGVDQPDKARAYYWECLKLNPSNIHAKERLQSLEQ